jgi:hypothetical protein
MPEKFGKGDPFLQSLTPKQRERYDGINASITRAAAEEIFKDSLLEEFKATSLTELAMAAQWAVKNNVTFDGMVPRYRKFIEKGSKK